MKALLVHSEDSIASAANGSWQWVIDFGLAPESTYRRWAADLGCDVTSIYAFSGGMADVREIQHVLQSGNGTLVDAHGLDWWDILSVLLASNFQNLLLLMRLATRLHGRWQLHATRPDALFTALAYLLESKIQVHRRQLGLREVRRYARVGSSLDLPQLRQVVQDKFDPQHSIRRRFASRVRKSAVPAILLPSAYINVSRTAVNYATRVPDLDFLLVYGRKTSILNSLPANVRAVTLDGYFTRTDRSEIAQLDSVWKRLSEALVRTRDEFSVANTAGMLDRMPALLRWGIALRDAWLNVFANEDITGCLCADDSNPYSRVPLILAAKRNLPTVACHHGALDYRMAFKTHYSDHYLTKSEIERDYLRRVCEVPPELLASAGAPTGERRSAGGERSTAVFFTEPYNAWGWRMDDVYRELIPGLLTMAQRCGLKLVLKLHPFESTRGHERMLKRLIPRSAVANIKIVAGPCSEELWRSTRFAMTVQSTAALECATRGIPVFLCTWLSDPYSGYAEQFAHFGIGHMLRSPEGMARIPELLERHSKDPVGKPVWDNLDSDKLRELLLGSAPKQRMPKLDAERAGAFAS